MNQYLVYHLLDQNEAVFAESRRGVEEMLRELIQPAPLKKEELMPHMSGILSTKSPEFIQEVQR